MPTNEEIIEYYRFSKLDYRLFNQSWSNISMHYGLWDISTKTQQQALLNENKILAEITNISKGDSVIDFGCGYGTSGIWLAQNRGCKVMGITLDEEQVKYAKKLAGKNKISTNVEFEVGDFHKTRFADESFSVVFAIESISHSSNKLTVLKEAFRILKPGGRIVLSDGFLTKPLASLSARESEIANKCFEGVHVPPVALKSEFEEILKQAGFKNVKFFDKTPQIFPTAKRVNKIGRLFYPLSKILNKIGMKALDKGHMDAFINQYYAFRDGIGIYGVFYGERL